jgi:hypothetical protein
MRKVVLVYSALLALSPGGGKSNGGEGEFRTGPVSHINLKVEVSFNIQMCRSSTGSRIVA